MVSSVVLEFFFGAGVEFSCEGGCSGSDRELNWRLFVTVIANSLARILFCVLLDLVCVQCCRSEAPSFRRASEIGYFLVSFSAVELVSRCKVLKILEALFVEHHCPSKEAIVLRPSYGNSRGKLSFEVILSTWHR